MFFVRQILSNVVLPTSGKTMNINNKSNKDDLLENIPGKKKKLPHEQNKKYVKLYVCLRHKSKK